MIHESRAETPQDFPGTPSEEDIRARSRVIWEREGCPDGCAQDHWQRARSELEAEMNRFSAPVPAPGADPCIPGASSREDIVHSPRKCDAVPVRRQPPANMPARRSKQTPSAPSIISADFALCGTVESEGDIHLDGRVEGAVHAAGLVVGEEAVIHGDIIADRVIVHGTVQGTIQARKLLLSANARVAGEVIAEMLAVELGAKLDCGFRPLGKIDALAEMWQRELASDAAASGAIPEKAPHSQAAA
jgi:cytoskeletal protein CcmA (bactofilin family)